MYRIVRIGKKYYAEKKRHFLFIPIWEQIDNGDNSLEEAERTIRVWREFDVKHKKEIIRIYGD